MSAFENTREQRLIQKDSDTAFCRIIAIENRTEADGYAFNVRIKDTCFTVHNYGLREPNKGNIPMDNFTGTATCIPQRTFQAAVQFADKEFLRSVEQEGLTPLPVGESCPV